MVAALVTTLQTRLDYRGSKHGYYLMRKIIFQTYSHQSLLDGFGSNVVECTFNVPEVS